MNDYILTAHAQQMCSECAIKPEWIQPVLSDPAVTQPDQRDPTLTNKLRRIPEMYVRMDEAPIIESEEVQPGLIVDFNENGQVIGIEMHGVKARNPAVNPKSLHFEVA